MYGYMSSDQTLLGHIWPCSRPVREAMTFHQGEIVEVILELRGGALNSVQCSTASESVRLRYIRLDKIQLSSLLFLIAAATSS